MQLKEQIEAKEQKLKVLGNKKTELDARLNSLEADAMVKKLYDMVTSENDKLRLEVLVTEKK